jgi:hypothetical protein
VIITSDDREAVARGPVPKRQPVGPALLAHSADDIAAAFVALAEPGALQYAVAESQVAELLLDRLEVVAGEFLLEHREKAREPF